MFRRILAASKIIPFYRNEIMKSIKAVRFDFNMHTRNTAYTGLT